jgi:chromosome segregation ATPase
MSRLAEYGYPIVPVSTIGDEALREALVACIGQLLGDRVKLWRRVDEYSAKVDTLQAENGTLLRKLTESRESTANAVKKAEEQDMRHGMKTKEYDENEKKLRLRIKSLERELAGVKKRDSHYKVEVRKWELKCSDLHEKLQKLLTQKVSYTSSPTYACFLFFIHS